MSLDARDPPDRATSAILGDLTLVRGIGEATRRRLEERGGCRTIAALMGGHPRYCRDAARLLDSIADTRDLVAEIERRRRRSDPLLLEASRFHAPEDFVFLDIETLGGLFSRPIILIGLARVSGGSITVRQYLSRSVEEEEAALAAVLPDLEAEGTALVTFNGRAFDVPPTSGIGSPATASRQTSPFPPTSTFSTSHAGAGRTRSPPAGLVRWRRGFSASPGRTTSRAGWCRSSTRPTVGPEAPPARLSRSWSITGRTSSRLPGSSPFSGGGWRWWCGTRPGAA